MVISCYFTHLIFIFYTQWFHPYYIYQAVVTPAPWPRWSFAQVLPTWRVHWRPRDRKPLVDWKRLGNGLSHKSSRRLPEILMVQTIQNQGFVARFATFYPYLWSFQQGESWQTIKFGGNLVLKKNCICESQYLLYIAMYTSWAGNFVL